MPEWESLHGYAELVAWGVESDVLPAVAAERLRREAEARPDDARAALERALALRGAVYRIFTAAAGQRGADPTDLARLDQALGDALAHRRLVASGLAYGWAWAEDDVPLDRVLWPVSVSAAALLTGPDLPRLRCCAGDDCSRLFLDASRNQRRRWCEMKVCGNRAKARRHYHRHRNSSSDAPIQ